jgi:phospholipid/cholesterol/gamma-HCH transport system substrate-binding protein
MKPFRERNPIPIGLVSLAVIGLLLLAAINVDNLPIIGGGTTYAAHFSESAGLREGDEVRIAGVRVGKVRSVALDGDKVLAKFRVKGAWVGDESTVDIKIKSVLGQKYLAVDPRGDQVQDPKQVISLQRTTAPYDVLEAFRGLAETTNEIDTQQLALSMKVLSDSVRESPMEIRNALEGLTRLSTTISSRDAELAKLLEGTRNVSGLLASRTVEIEKLINDGNLLLAELQERRNAITRLLDGTKALSEQLRGLIADNSAQLTPVLNQLEAVTNLLLRNQQKLSEGLYLMGPFARMFTNTLGSGRWFDSYVYGVLPPSLGTVQLLPGGP